MHMDSVLIYSRVVRQETAESATKPYRPIVVSSSDALAREIVSGRNLLAVIVQIEELPEELEQLLRSIRRHFPILPVLFVTDAELPTEIDGDYAHISSSLEEGALTARLRERLADIATKDRRRYNRYDWPLTGSISGESSDEGTPFRIRSLSAGGAFLEQRSGMPEPGSTVTLRVYFQDCSFTTACHVLERRMASSNLPPGQGVQFTSLSEEARTIIDRIVRDALMTILLDPTAEPEVPTLGDEDFGLSLAPEFTLG
jgi:hypothetical protein